ncbi:hypothetical protein Ae201684P_013921 [Aphanomyces euteiches]|nr:hypothetical protein Ae201684P_013921 [Aphanomyces euteiches]
MTTLFEPLQVGAITLRHRVVMAPLTRTRAVANENGVESVPTPIMAMYYGQRASEGGLIVSEATPVCPEGRPSAHVPCMKDSDPVNTWSTLLKQLNPLKLAYVHLVEPRIAGGWDSSNAPDPEQINLKPFRDAYDGVLIVAGGHTAESAAAVVKEGRGDAVAFGRYFISNPDLPARVKHGHPFTPYNRSTFYTATEVGYTDYKSWEEQQQEGEATA